MNRSLCHVVSITVYIPSGCCLCWALLVLLAPLLLPVQVALLTVATLATLMVMATKLGHFSTVFKSLMCQMLLPL